MGFLKIGKIYEKSTSEIPSVTNLYYCVMHDLFSNT